VASNLVEAPGIEPFDAIAGVAVIMPIQQNSCCFGSIGPAWFRVDPAWLSVSGDMEATCR